MITRQDLYKDLFKLKNSGVDVSYQLKIMESKSGIPKEVVEFLQDKSPQFQFYRDLKKNQRALMKNILNYENLDILLFAPFSFGFLPFLSLESFSLAASVSATASSSAASFLPIIP